MRSADFNEQAMDAKIQANMVKGLTLPQIKKLLREEQLENFKTIAMIERRNVELADQIDYMDEKYG